MRPLAVSNGAMALIPQASDYRPDPQIAPLAPWLGDGVAPADFPQTILRFRNDRWAAAVGLDGMSDGQWLAHFGRFQPLEGNLPAPLALRYHGHQFRHYNPDLGDGRGFLFAQLRDGGGGGSGRLLDLATKGSGQTPWSRAGDGRLTLKGAVREALATEMLEALGVYTSKSFSIIETGEALERGDEPSPTRSAVLVRLGHSHIRIGSFQRLATLGLEAEMAELVDWCIAQYIYPKQHDAGDSSATVLLGAVVERMADLAASYMVAGFVHGVLNSDNMAITGESFDYGPWRFAPQWKAGFTAAYFDHAGLYAFGRQPEAIYWNCGQLAVALRILTDSAPLVAQLERFGGLYLSALAKRFCWRLGVQSRDQAQDQKMLAVAEKAMISTGQTIDGFFFRWRGGGLRGGAARGSIDPGEEEWSDVISQYVHVNDALLHPYWQDEAPQSMLIDEVEAIWQAIDQADDWQKFHAKLAEIRRMSAAYGAAPRAPAEG